MTMAPASRRGFIAALASLPAVSAPAVAQGLGTTLDPILALVQAEREAQVAMDAFYVRLGGASLTDATSAEEIALGNVERRAFEAAQACPATTVAGLLAFLNMHFERYPEDFDEGDDTSLSLSHARASLALIAGKGDA